MRKRDGGTTGRWGLVEEREVRGEKETFFSVLLSLPSIRNCLPTPCLSSLGVWGGRDPIQFKRGQLALIPASGYVSKTPSTLRPYLCANVNKAPHFF